MSAKQLIPIIVLLLVLLVVGNAIAQGGVAPESTFTLDRAVIGSGGLQASGGDFDLGATAGQPAAGVLTGGDFSLNVGFWSADYYHLYLPLIMRKYG